MLATCFLVTSLSLLISQKIPLQKSFSKRIQKEERWKITLRKQKTAFTLTKQIAHVL